MTVARISLNGDQSEDVTARKLATSVEDLRRTAILVGSGLFGGAICGALIGGLGGRLLMLVLRVASGSSVRGRTTDDGYVVGVFTTATLSLVILTAVLGGVGGLFFLVVREWLPEGGRPLLTGAFMALVGGSVFVRSDGWNFTALRPRVLAVLGFVLLPGIYGTAMSLVVERFRETWPRSRFKGWIPPSVLALLALSGPSGLALLITLIAGSAVARRRPGVVERWQSPAVQRAGRGLLVVFTVVALFDLGKNVRQLL